MLLEAAILNDFVAASAGEIAPDDAIRRQQFEQTTYAARLLEVILRESPNALKVARATARKDVELVFGATTKEPPKAPREAPADPETKSELLARLTEKK
jgi:hypothetical protein